MALKVNVQAAPCGALVEGIDLTRPLTPAGTLLFGNVIPPTGGDTLFANQYDAWDALPAAMKALLHDEQGVHSARRGYARQGRYGERDAGVGFLVRTIRSHLAGLAAHRVAPVNVGVKLAAEADGDWPRKDNNHVGLERPGDGCRSGSA